MPGTFLGMGAAGWGALGSVASGLGSIAGGLMGNDDNSMQLAQMQRHMYRRSVRWRVGDAKAAGIHPLIAMGVNPATLPAMDTRGKSGPNYAAIGQGVSRALNAANTAKENELAQEQIKSIKLENNLKEIEVAEKALEFRNLNKNPAPSFNEDNIYVGQNIKNGRLHSSNSNSDILGIGSTGEFVTRPSVPLSSSHGVISGTQPFVQYSEDDQGRFWKVPSQQIQEAMSEGSIVTQARYNATQVTEQLNAVRLYMNWNNPKLSQFRSNFLKSRPLQNHSKDIALWDVMSGMWVRRKKTLQNQNSVFIPVKKGRWLHEKSRALAGKLKSLYRKSQPQPQLLKSH